MDVGKRIVGAGSSIFIALLLLSPVAAVISIGSASERNLLLFLAQTLTVLPALALFMAGVPEPAARALAGGFVAICVVCFVIRQYWRISAWRKKD